MFENWTTYTVMAMLHHHLFHFEMDFVWKELEDGNCVGFLFKRANHI